MKPPRGFDIDACAADPLEEFSSTVRAGRLVGLLKGDGLTKSTVEELLRPESASTLKAILTDHLLPERECDRVDRGECDPAHGPGSGSGRGGNVLVFRRKKET